MSSALSSSRATIRMFQGLTTRFELSTLVAVLNSERITQPPRSGGGSGATSDEASKARAPAPGPVPPRLLATPAGRSGAAEGNAKAGGAAVKDSAAPDKAVARGVDSGVARAAAAPSPAAAAAATAARDGVVGTESASDGAAAAAAAAAARAVVAAARAAGAAADSAAAEPAAALAACREGDAPAAPKSEPTPNRARCTAVGGAEIVA